MKQYGQNYALALVLHSERPKLYAILAFPSAIGLIIPDTTFYPDLCLSHIVKLDWMLWLV